eukprot:Skav204984  [mRNA]  locus=scaffold1180:555715:566964:- [translate_table: standard]
MPRVTVKDKRRRRLLEFNIAKRDSGCCGGAMLRIGETRGDGRLHQEESESDGPQDSCLQMLGIAWRWLTLKYLQYEFFATSAHAISSVLPVRMEFRPMVEMTPEQLEAQVEMALQEADEANEGSPKDQAALDFLIGGGHEEDHEESSGAEQVRMPTTVPRVQRLKERRRAQQARRKEEEDARQIDGRQELGWWTLVGGRPGAGARAIPAGWTGAEAAPALPLARRPPPPPRPRRPPRPGGNGGQVVELLVPPCCR